MSLFARTRKPEAAPKRKVKGLTCAELSAAVASVRETMAAECSAAQTVERLLVLTDNAADDHDLVKIAGPAPVSSAELDDALAEINGCVPASATRTLKRVRELLKSTENRERAATAGYVTHAELLAALDAMGAVVGCAAHAFGETYFRPAELIASVRMLLERSPPLTRPFLQRLLDAITTYRAPPSEKDAWHDRFFREATGIGRS